MGLLHGCRRRTHAGRIRVITGLSSPVPSSAPTCIGAAAFKSPRVAACLFIAPPSSAPRCLFICLPPSPQPELTGARLPARHAHNTKCANQKLAARCFSAAALLRSGNRERRQSSREVSFSVKDAGGWGVARIHSVPTASEASLPHKRLIKRTS